MKNMEIKENTKVVSKFGEKGRILENKGQRLLVEFPSGILKYREDAFLGGYLSFEDPLLQEEVESEKKRLEEEKAKSLKAVEEGNAVAKAKAEKEKAEEETKKAGAKKSKKEKSQTPELDSGSAPKVILLRRHASHAKQGAIHGKYVTIDVDSVKMKTKNKQQVVAYDFHKDFSPLCIGPVTMGDGLVAPNLELAWQCSKVFACHANDGVPNAEYFAWRKSCFENPPSSEEDQRAPWKELGYETKGAKVSYKAHQVCFYAYFDSKQRRWRGLNIVDLRKKFLASYVQAVSRTPSYAYLQKLLREGKKIALVGQDVFNYSSLMGRRFAFEHYKNQQIGKKLPVVYGEEFFESIDSIAKLFAFPLPLGHAAIIKAMLMGALGLDEQGNLIDGAGILSSM